jgi:hypothetical protein
MTHLIVSLIRTRIGAKKVKFLTYLYWLGFGVAAFLTASGLLLSFNLYIHAETNPSRDWRGITVSQVPISTTQQSIVLPSGKAINIPAGINPLLSMPLPSNLSDSSLQGILDAVGMDPQQIKISQIPLLHKNSTLDPNSTVTKAPKALLNKRLELWNLTSVPTANTAPSPPSISDLSSTPTFGDLGVINDHLSLNTAFNIPSDAPFVTSHGLMENNPNEQVVAGTIFDRTQKCDHPSCSSVIAETPDGKTVNLGLSRQEEKGRSCTNLGCSVPSKDAARYIFTAENIGIALTKADGDNDNIVLNSSFRYCSWGNCTDYLGLFPLFITDANSSFPLPITTPGFTASSSSPQSAAIPAVASTPATPRQTTMSSPPSRLNSSALASALESNGISVTSDQVALARDRLVSGNAALANSPALADGVIDLLLAGRSNPGATNPTYGSNKFSAVRETYYANIQARK